MYSLNVIRYSLSAFILANKGKIPLAVIEASEREKCLIFQMNALQIVEQLRIKYHQVQSSAIMFKEYAALGWSQLAESLQTIEQLVVNKHYKHAIDKLDKLIDLSLLALDYYHKYNKLYLGVCIVLAYLGWIVYLLNQTTESSSNNNNNNNNNHKTNKNKQAIVWFVNRLFAAIALISVLLSWLQRFPLTYYVYTLLPVCLWRDAFARPLFWTRVAHISSQATLSRRRIVATVLKCTGALIAIECLVLTFKYRWIFSMLLVVHAAAELSAAMSMSMSSKHDHKGGGKHVRVLMVVSSLLLAVFPCLPVIQGYSHFYLVYASAGLVNVACVWAKVGGGGSQHAVLRSITSGSRWAANCLLVLNVVTLVNIVWIRKSIEWGGGLPVYGQLISCTSILSSVLIPVLADVALKTRLALIMLSLVNVYHHLSIS